MPACTPTTCLIGWRKCSKADEPLRFPAPPIQAEIAATEGVFFKPELHRHRSPQRFGGCYLRTHAVHAVGEEPRRDLRSALLQFVGIGERVPTVQMSIIGMTEDSVEAKVTAVADVEIRLSARWRALLLQRCSALHYAGRRRDTDPGICRLSRLVCRRARSRLARAWK